MVWPPSPIPARRRLRQKDPELYRQFIVGGWWRKLLVLTLWRQRPGRSLDLRPAWSTKQVPEQPGLCRETHLPDCWYFFSVFFGLECGPRSLKVTEATILHDGDGGVNWRKLDPHAALPSFVLSPSHFSETLLGPGEKPRVFKLVCSFVLKTNSHSAFQWPGIHYVAQAGLELMPILLSQPLGCEACAITPRPGCSF